MILQSSFTSEHLCSNGFQIVRKGIRSLVSMVSSAADEIAPVPPSGVLPDDYIAVRCQMCGRWSTTPAPWPLNKNDEDRVG